MWLRDFIPKDLEHHHHHTRVLTYGYDTTLAGSLSNVSVRDISKQFLKLLKSVRLRKEVCICREYVSGWGVDPSQEQGRPIIFVGHSLGGLVIKQVSMTSPGFFFSLVHFLTITGITRGGLPKR